MPRNSNGTYTLPSGNPVVSGEVISTSWANPTMSDVANEITNSLDRSGRGGMQAPFKNFDGTISAPGMTWSNEPTTGFYRAAAQDMRVTVGGLDRMRWNVNGAQLWNGTIWSPLVTEATFATLGTAQGYARKSIDESITGNWTFADYGSAYGPTFNGYPRFTKGFQADGYMEVAVPTGFSSDFANITFWDYDGALNEKGWNLESDRSLKNFGINATTDAGVKSAVLTATRSAAAITSIQLGNATNKPQILVEGRITQGDILTEENTLGWTNFRDGFSTAYAQVDGAGGAAAGYWMSQPAAPLDEKWWGLEAKVDGTLGIDWVPDGSSTQKNAMLFTRNGNALTNIQIGNATDNPAVQVNGSLNATQALQLNGVGAVLETRALIGVDSITGGGSLTTDYVFKLVNDTPTPGSSWYYGTNASGTKGWFPLSGVVGVPEAPTDGNVYGRKNASWVSIGAGTDPYVLKTGDTMTGSLYLTANSRPLRIASTGPSILVQDTDGTANQRTWDIIGGNNQLIFRGILDDLTIARVALQFTQKTDGTAGISNIVLGNTTDYPPVYAYATQFFVGNNTSLPTVTSARQIGLYGTAGRMEVGMYLNDATYKPRIAMFTDDTGNVGLNYTFSTGVTRLQFHAAGAEIFSYAPAGVTLKNGKYLFTTRVDGTTSVRLCGVSTGDVAYFGSDSFLSTYVFGSSASSSGTSLIFRTANSDRLTISDSIATFSGAVRINGTITAPQIISRTAETDRMILVGGQDTTLGANARLDLNGGGYSSNAGDLTGYSATNSNITFAAQGTGVVRLSSGGSTKLEANNSYIYVQTTLTTRSNNLFRMYNAANDYYGAFGLNTTGKQIYYQDNGTVKGAMIHWASSGLQWGNIIIATAEPAATGNPGDIVLVYE